MYANGIETRERILAVGKKLFMEKGYRATTYRDICSAAGINPGTLAHHFGGKTGLADELCHVTIARLMKIVEDRFPQEDASTQVLVATMSYFRLLFEDSSFRGFFAEYVVDNQEGATVANLDNGVTLDAFADVLGEESARIVVSLDYGMDRAFEELILNHADEMDQEASVRLFFLMAYAPIPDAEELIDRACTLSESLKLRFDSFQIEIV